MAWVFDRSGMLPGTEAIVLEWIEALGDLDEFSLCAGTEDQVTLYDSLLAICLHELHNYGVHCYATGELEATVARARSRLQ